MGPQGDDLFCPCKMKSMGLESHNSWDSQKIKELTQALSKFSTQESEKIEGNNLE